MKVVTANYRDRKSKLKWLVRDEDQPIHLAVPFNAIMATGVEFKPSNEDEEGFGCTMIALCKTVEGYYEPLKNFEPKQLARLQFNWNSFVMLGEFPKEISEVEVLYLNADGHMYADVAGEGTGTKIAKQKTAAVTA